MSGRFSEEKTVFKHSPGGATNKPDLLRFRQFAVAPCRTTERCRRTGARSSCANTPALWRITGIPPNLNPTSSRSPPIMSIPTFTRLSPSVHLHTPASSPRAPTILICSWLNVSLRHITKYTSAYTTLFEPTPTQSMRSHDEITGSSKMSDTAVV
jgi:hypothetical protein